jgi:multidrug resistance protein, MATE family
MEKINKPIRNNEYSRLLSSGILRRELRQTFTLALPLMMGELSGMLMGVAGTLMLGHLSQTALAAQSIAGVVYIGAMILVWGTLRILPSPVAEGHELRDGQKVNTLFKAALLLIAFFSIVCTFALWLGIQNFDILKQDPSVSAMSIDYLHHFLYAIPALVFFATVVNFLDAFEYVRLTMVVAFVGLAVDVLLNWLLIYGNWGFPQWGMNAIAINTGIVHFLMGLYILGVILTKKELAYFIQVKTDWAAVWQAFKHFIRMGVPSGLQMLVEFMAFGVGTIIIGQISKTEQAAHQIALNLISATYVTILGISTAGMIRVGQALAYRSRIRIWLAGVSALILGVGIMLIPTFFFIVMPKTIATLYIVDPSVIGIASGLVFLGGLFQMADALQAVSISLLRAIKDVVQPFILSFIAFWIVGLPIGYWLAVHQGWNAKGIWVCYVVSLIIQAYLFVTRFFKLVNRGQF